MSTTPSGAPARTAPTHPFAGLGVVSAEALAHAGVTADVPPLVEAFLGLMHRMRDHITGVAASHCLTPPMALALRLLDEPRPQREIASALGCDPSYVTGIVDRLEELGAVERTADPSDRRVKLIVLTERGEELRREIAISMLRDAPIASGLDPEKRAQLAELLREALATGPIAVECAG